MKLLQMQLVEFCRQYKTRDTNNTQPINTLYCIVLLIKIHLSVNITQVNLTKTN